MYVHVHVASVAMVTMLVEFWISLLSRVWVAWPVKVHSVCAHAIRTTLPPCPLSHRKGGCWSCWPTSEPGEFNQLPHYSVSASSLLLLFQSDDGLGGLFCSGEGLDLTGAYLLESLGWVTARHIACIHTYMYIHMVTTNNHIHECAV